MTEHKTRRGTCQHCGTPIHRAKISDEQTEWVHTDPGDWMYCKVGEPTPLKPDLGFAIWDR